MELISNWLDALPNEQPIIVIWYGDYKKCVRNTPTSYGCKMYAALPLAKYRGMIFGQCGNHGEEKYKQIHMPANTWEEREKEETIKEEKTRTSFSPYLQKKKKIVQQRNQIHTLCANCEVIRLPSQRAKRSSCSYSEELNMAILSHSEGRPLCSIAFVLRFSWNPEKE